MTPQEFIAKWGPGGPAFDLNERQGAQPHFMDLCELLGVPTPGSEGDYIFEQDTLVLGEARGYADVFKRDHFAWENKAPGKNLDSALKQLLTYSLALSNPPLLVVCDRLTIRIHTRFNGHPSETHTVLLQELDQPEKQALLRRIWLDPESFRPKKTSRDITEAAARSFSTLAEGLRRRNQEMGPDKVAHFLTQCLFCFFAEDVGLLPGRMFESLVNNKSLTSEKLATGLNNLFTVMRDGGLYGNDDIPWFNGGLFKKIKVPRLTILDMTELRNAAALNWSAIDVSIFGTLFERGLDPAKRSQLGAHYTDPATIMRIIEPVVQRPLLQKWELVAHTIRGLQDKSTKKSDKNYRAAKACFVEWLDYLKNYRVLDPACGSGNFLFLGLKALKDIEHRSHLEAATLGLDREADLVTGPHNVLGIELNEYAAELARVTVWIGELQWRMAHGYEFKRNPVLEPLDHIECRDALLTFPVIASGAQQSSDSVIASEARQSMSQAVDADSGARAAQTPGAHALRSLKSPPTSAPPTPRSGPSSPTFASGVKEAAWPKADVVIGNPPFLGDKKMRAELGDAYTEVLRKTYGGRVPGGADLVCYWFEKARTAIETNGLGAAGLVATNSIRGGKNRKVLEAICETTRIYEAWSDEGWVNEGAAVRVSLVAFGTFEQPTRLNGQEVERISAVLTAVGEDQVLDLTLAHRLTECAGSSFMGVTKSGPFDISAELAREMLLQPNPHGLSNAEVLRPSVNGADIAKRPSGEWILDFGARTLYDAALFERPFGYSRQAIYPARQKSKTGKNREVWWQFERPRPEMFAAFGSQPRYIATCMVAKHRLFVWLQRLVVPENVVIVIARADDTTFGILHSRFHELWSLRMGTSLEDRPRYTPTTCFETFPFPAGLSPADTAHQRTETLPDGALIPADIFEQNGAPAQTQHAQAATKYVASSSAKNQRAEAGMVRMSGPISKSEAYEAPASESAPPSAHQQATRQQAIQIATAAKKLNDLREAWLNPPEWTHKVPEVTPLGMTQSPYPDRIEPKPGISETDLKALQKRTLTNLYNARPAWLAMAHSQLDAAVATAYGWTDYTPDMSDEEILKRLLALNLERSVPIQPE